jgi:hypothetical protein
MVCIKYQHYQLPSSIHTRKVSINHPMAQVRSLGLGHSQLVTSRNHGVNRQWQGFTVTETVAPL